MIGRLLVSAIVVGALMTVGVVGHHIENAKNPPPTTSAATGSEWAENVLADTAEQQTALDNVDADMQLPDVHALAQDCLSIQASLDAWAADESGIRGVSIRTSYTNTVLKLSQAVTACNNKDMASLAALVASAESYLNATVGAIPPQS